MNFNHGTSQSACVAILIPQNLDFELCEKKDLNSKLLITKIKVDNTIYVLCNIYAPTREHKTDQNIFIIVLKDTLIQYANENVLLGGDFNCYPDLKLDKIDIMSNKNDNITLHTRLRDLFPNESRYTWHSRRNLSRLDYWFISEHLLNELENYKIIPGLHSDNSIIYINLGYSNPKRGKSIWKFNNSLLQDKKYASEIKNIIQICRIDYKNLEDWCLAWEMTKMKIRSYSVPYCVQIREKESNLNYH